MARGLIRGAVATSLALALVGIGSSAMATPSNITLTIGSTTTSAKFSTGTGQIRAKQECNSSNGQTSWWQYGYWMTRTYTSTTGSCSYRTPSSPWYEISG
jgi:hypothetical protein